MAQTLKEKLADMIPRLRDERKALMTEHRDTIISQVTVAQAIGGMRGVKGMVCDTSVVEPDKGLIIRGLPIMKIKDKLPEEVFWLLITGELPSADELKLLQKDLKEHSEVPNYVWKVLKAMPKTSHPMAMLDTAILTMEQESVFRKRYTEGMKKTEYWEPTLEDAMRVIGTIHTIAAGVYRIRYKKGALIEPSKKLDWAADFAKMLGLPPKKGQTADMMRLYLTLHSDHEGGNVSANTCHTVGSALSDAFYAVSAGLNGLAGPLHGLANQECLSWILELREKFGSVPSKENMTKFTWDTLRSGKVIPGYGHAVLRVTDPRFAGFLEFGQQHLADDPVFKTVELVFNVVPKVLQEFSEERVKAGKNPIANCWPNVDAGSGALLYHFGLTEFPFYTVMFSVSRAMGMLAQLVLNRAMGTAITRPKSVSAEWIKANAGK